MYGFLVLSSTFVEWILHFFFFLFVIFIPFTLWEWLMNIYVYVCVCMLEKGGWGWLTLRTKCDWLTEYDRSADDVGFFLLFCYFFVLFFSFFCCLCLYIYLYDWGLKIITSIRSHHHHRHRNHPFCSFSLVFSQVSNAFWHRHWQHCCRRWPRNLWRHDRNRPWPWLP